MDKLQLAIETLESYQRLRTDSRNWGIIDNMVEDTLKQLKDEPAKSCAISITSEKKQLGL